MVAKHDPPALKAEAVALCRSRPEATDAQNTDDLGVNREKSGWRVGQAVKGRSARI